MLMMLITLPFFLPLPQDTGAVDMTGMGIYAQEEAVEEAARDTPKRRARSSNTSQKRPPSTAEKAEMCAFANKHFKMLTADQKRTVRSNCK